MLHLFSVAAPEDAQRAVSAFQPFQTLEAILALVAVTGVIFFIARLTGHRERRVKVRWLLMAVAVTGALAGFIGTHLIFDEPSTRTILIGIAVTGWFCAGAVVYGRPSGWQRRY